MYQSQAIRSTVTSAGKLALSMVTTEVPAPQDHQVVIRVEATPINPSDLVVLLTFAADLSSMQRTGQGKDAVVTMDINPKMLPALAKRMDLALPVGNEGSGVVVAAGKDCQHLLGKVVGTRNGAMYSQYQCVDAAQCMVMHEGTSPEQAASSFVNPLTALAFVETMKLEGQKSLVHTAAASNLGQMLVKVCQADQIPLVNIVRKPAQVELLRGLGAEHVVNSSDDDFMQQLIAAVEVTDARLGFDATGGGNEGRLVGQILTAMEAVASKQMTQYSPYGSMLHKQVYMYGSLDMTPTTLTRTYGMQWGVGAWLLLPTLQRLGADKFQQMSQRVADEIQTTFASHYHQQISLVDLLDPDHIRHFAKQATGEKYLVRPQQ